VPDRSRESDRVGPVPVKAAVRRAKQKLAGAVFGKGRQALPGSSSLLLGLVPTLLLGLVGHLLLVQRDSEEEEKAR
jgi:hypothetical protein